MSEYTEPDILKLRLLWLSRDYGTAEERLEALENFDRYIQDLIEFDEKEDTPIAVAGKPMSLMFLELMIELDKAVEMIPPKVAKYRDLLAAHGLDGSAVKKESEGSENSGRQGMAGVNVADQGALEYHGSLMRLASMFANAVLEEANPAIVNSEAHKA